MENTTEDFRVIQGMANVFMKYQVKQSSSPKVSLLCTTIFVGKIIHTSKSQVKWFAIFYGHPWSNETIFMRESRQSDITGYHRVSILNLCDKLRPCAHIHRQHTSSDNMYSILTMYLVCTHIFLSLP